MGSVGRQYWRPVTAEIEILIFMPKAVENPAGRKRKVVINRDQMSDLHCLKAKIL